MIDVTRNVGGDVIHAQFGTETAGSQRDHISGHIGMMHDAVPIANPTAHRAKMLIRLLRDERDDFFSDKGGQTLDVVLCSH